MLETFTARRYGRGDLSTAAIYLHYRIRVDSEEGEINRASTEVFLAPLCNILFLELIDSRFLEKERARERGRETTGDACARLYTQPDLFLRRRDKTSLGKERATRATTRGSG